MKGVLWYKAALTRLRQTTAHKVWRRHCGGEPGRQKQKRGRGAEGQRGRGAEGPESCGEHRRLQLKLKNKMAPFSKGQQWAVGHKGPQVPGKEPCGRQVRDSAGQPVPEEPRQVRDRDR